MKQEAKPYTWLSLGQYWEPRHGSDYRKNIKQAENYTSRQTPWSSPSEDDSCSAFYRIQRFNTMFVRIRYSYLC